MEDAVLLAIAVTRRDEAVAYLLDTVGDDSPANAARAVTALRIYVQDATVADRVREAVEARDAALPNTAFADHFG